MNAPIRVAVTGAAGNIGYALLFRLASGACFGKDQPIILQVFFEQNLKEVDQVTVTKEGKFAKMLKASGQMWKNEGVVIIKASYGTEFVAEKAIEYFLTSGEKTYENYEVKIPDAGTFDVQYELKGN